MVSINILLITYQTEHYKNTNIIIIQYCDFGPQQDLFFIIFCLYYTPCKYLSLFYFFLFYRMQFGGKPNFCLTDFTFAWIKVYPTFLLFLFIIAFALTYHHICHFVYFTSLHYSSCLALLAFVSTYFCMTDSLFCILAMEVCPNLTFLYFCSLLFLF